MFSYVLEAKQIITVEANNKIEAEAKILAGDYTTSSIGDLKFLAKLKKLDEKEND
jgi:hypothetical protein